MIKKWRFHELDAMHLNFGVPLVISLVLLLVNLEFFYLVFVEDFFKLFKLYFYISFSMLVLRLLLTKKQKAKKKILKLSIYEFGVLNSLLITLFLIVNLNFSEKYYTKNIAVNSLLVNELKTLISEPRYLKVFEISTQEYDKYFNKGYTINVQINKSYFGYKFIESRTFQKIK